MAKLYLLSLVFLLFQLLCGGFDLTLDPHSPDPSSQHGPRQVCSVLQCVETLPDGSDDHANRTRTVTSLTVSGIRINGLGDVSGRWRELASVTSQRPTLNRVSDGVKVTGTLSDLQASLSLEFSKVIDCQDSQFSCVAIYVDRAGQTSVKKSLVGKAIGSSDYAPHIQNDNVSDNVAVTENVPDKVPDLQKVSWNDGSLPGLLLQLTNSIQMKVDWVGSRLADSINALENRLEDKIGQLKEVEDDRRDRLDDDMEKRLRALVSTVDDLESRLEDKMTQKLDQMLQNLGKLESSCTDKAGAGDQLTSQLTTLKDKLDTNTRTLETCVSEVRSLNGSLGQNVDQCMWAVDNRLSDLASGLNNVSGLTHALMSQVSTIRNGYGGGALVPVSEFFDPLNTGKTEWRLAFRGTAFNNVRVLPAYMYGTGIPAQVEEGCKQFNRSLPCSNHYRNNHALDNWSGVDEVLFAIYKDGQMVKRVVFNGKGSTFTSWFAANRVLMSSWVDLTTQPHNIFSIVGQDAGDHFRRFFINMDFDQGCNGYRGWFKAQETFVGCPDEKDTLAIPKFNFAPGDTFSLWSGAAVADAFGVFLRYE